MHLNSDGCADVSASRIALMLSVAYQGPVYERIFDHIEAALQFWNSNDQAAANFRLMYAHLAELDDPRDIERLVCAERLLDSGVTPASICDALDAMEQIGKFDAGELRVPAGSGPTSGRWAKAWSAIQH